MGSEVRPIPIRPWFRKPVGRRIRTHAKSRTIRLTKKGSVTRKMAKSRRPGLIRLIQKAAG